MTTTVARTVDTTHESHYAFDETVFRLPTPEV
jgi:hypothetical protein